MKPILICDDDQTFNELLVRELKREGFSVISACSVMDAKSLLEKTQPLLICSDLMLPDGNGFDLLAYAKEAIPAVPFIVMSNCERENFGEESMRRGAILFIHKCRSNQLVALIIKYANQALPVKERLFGHQIMYICADGQKGSLLRTALRQRQYRTTVVSDLFSAQDRLVGNPDIELILCDAVIPQNSAMDFLELLRENSLLHILCEAIPPCIVIMGPDAPAPEGAYLQQGALACIQTPINIPLLIQVMEEYFELLQN